MWWDQLTALPIIFSSLSNSNMSPNDTKLKLLLGIGCINLKEFCHVKASEPKYYTILIMDGKKY